MNGKAVDCTGSGVLLPECPACRYPPLIGGLRVLGAQGRYTLM